MGAMVKSDDAKSSLVTSRKPVGVTTDTTKTVGAVAVNDSLIFIAVAWLAVIFLWVTVRKSNV